MQKIYLLLTVSTLFCGLSIIAQDESAVDLLIKEEFTSHQLSAFVDRDGVLVPNELEKTRKKLNTRDNSGDEFVLVVTEKYLEEYPLVLSQEETFDRYLMGVSLMDKEREKLPDSVWVYEVVKEMLLTPLSDSVHYLIHQQGWSAGREPIATWLNELALHKYYIDIPVSNRDKVVKHLKNGDFRYLWHKATTSYKKEALLIALLGLVMLFLLIYWILMRRRKKRIEQ